jgi:Bacterial RNA polymerase, alpha chain C terminal domain
LKKSKEGFLSALSAPAQRALTSAGISNLKQLSKYSEKEVLSLHGVGPSSIPKLKKALNASGLSFIN